jgi:RNA polymerase sigma factor (sigma-70 family)
MSARPLPQSVLTVEELEEACKRHRQGVMTYVMRLGRAWMREPWDEAEDIVQVVMQRARNARLHFDRNRSFSAWIMTIAHNQTLNYARARENRIRLERGASIELYGADSLGKSAPTDHLVVEDSEDSARRRNI